MTTVNKERIIGLDILRTLAILFVIAGHFFVLNTPFYTSTFKGVSMFLQATILPLLLTGVPLFIMITGYLNSNKTVSRKYYSGCIRVLFAYLLFSIITVLFRKYWMHEDLSWIQWGLKILDFSAIPYGWYIEMWIGLFLLTPFLNYMYKAIPSKKYKLVLIATLYALTALPDMFNRYGLHLVPGFWAKCYPLTFFFIGSYIREYRPEFNKWFLAAVILVLSLINPVSNSIFFDNHDLVQVAGGPSGIFGVPIAAAFFLICYNIDFKSIFARKLFTKISTVSLDMYLCCYIIDMLVYPYFLNNYYINQNQFGIYFFVIIPILFLGSFILAYIKDRLCKLISPKL